MLTIEINSRTAIPIRAIPYVTGWRLSPLDIAIMLANPNSHCDASITSVNAYRISDKNTAEPLPPESFNVIVLMLRAMDSDAARLAIESLPSGVFVFEDEIFPLYQAGNRHLSRRESHEIAIVHDVWMSNPPISSADNALMFEGFLSPKQTPLRANARQFKLDLLESLVAKIEKAAGELNLPFDRDSIPGTKKDFADLLVKVHGAELGLALSSLADYFTEIRCVFKQGTRQGMLDEFSAAILSKIQGNSPD